MLQIVKGFKTSHISAKQKKLNGDQLSSHPKDLRFSQSSSRASRLLHDMERSYFYYNSFVGKQCLLFNFWPSSRLLGFLCLFWGCVCCLFFEVISSTSSFLLHERHMKRYIHQPVIKIYLNTWNEWRNAGTSLKHFQSQKLKHLVPGSMLNAKHFFLSKKYLASRQWLHKASPLTMGNQFPRLSHENKYPMSSAYVNGNLKWMHHAGATYSKHERIQHRQISKLATNLNILRASFKAEFQASQLSDQNDICQFLIFSGHRDKNCEDWDPAQ